MLRVEFQIGLCVLHVDQLMLPLPIVGLMCLCAAFMNVSLQPSTSKQVVPGKHIMKREPVL